jgi:hypothetical protein
MDISSTNPLSPSPLYRDSVAARQRELPPAGSLESAGQQALEASTAREAQLQAATQQVAGKPQNTAAQLNNRAIDLQFSLQAQLLSTQAVRVQQTQQQADSAAPAANNPPAANLTGDSNSGNASAASLASPSPQAAAQQTAAPRSTPQPATRAEDSNRAELNASAQQQAVAQYQASQSLLQSSSGMKFSA